MDMKIQKEFTLVVGTNNPNATKEDLIEAAMKLEMLGNSNLSKRFHIFAKEE